MQSRFAQLFLTLLTVGMVAFLWATDSVPMPELPDIPPSEDGEGEVVGPTDMSWMYPTNQVWMIETYANEVDWQAWEAKVAERMESLADVAYRCPPMPEGVVSYVGQPVEELSLNACTNNIPAVLVGNVKTWTFKVTETIDTDGSRTLLTHANNTVFHEQAVPAEFDPEAWSLEAYTADGVLPAWVAADEERRTEWFRFRGRERLGLSFLMVEPGRLQDYKDELTAQAEAIRQAQEDGTDESEAQPRAFGPTAMEITPNSITFGFYNPERVDIDVIGFPSLTEPIVKSYIGRVPAKGKDVLWFDSVRPVDATTYFYHFFDGNTDADGDGIPDGMELNYFETDPEKRDTAGSGMDDWQKIFMYGMDATVGDTDGDGLPDGWELLHDLDPTSAEGNNGSEGDPDQDGIINRLEFLYTTHPSKADTDEDGLTDSEETGYATLQHHVAKIDTSTATELVSASGSTPVNFPFPIRIGGRQYTQAMASASGVLTFLNENLPRGAEVSFLNAPLTGSPFRNDTYTLALYWGELYWNPNFQSTIRVVTLETDGIRKVVIEYLNFAQAGKDSRTLGRLQVEIPENANETGITVYYTTLQGDMNTSEAVIGAQRPDAKYAELYTIGQNQENAVVVADAVTYVFGSGTNPTLKDTDGDGVLDGAEVLAGTSASSDDNDFDGMPDWWELKYGLDPNVADGDEDADGDSLSNLTEFRIGTNPSALDSDGDTLPDAAEVGTFIRRSHIKALDTSAGEVRYSYTKEEVDGYKNTALPFPVMLDGVEYNAVALNADGFITFIPTTETTPSPNRPLANADMRTSPLDQNYPSIALYWDNLMLAESFMSTMRIVLLTDTEGKKTAVIEYLNMAKQQGALSFLAYPEACTSLARMQVIIPENVAAEGIEVRYPTLQGSFDGTSATIGAQHRGGTNPEQFAIVYNEPSKIALGDSITYHFGLGTNPALADSDYDGLNDNRELELDTNPYEPDTDGDGMSDGWENQYDRDPTVANEGAIDSDNDGLTDRQEAAYKTNPSLADSDGDGVADLAEINQSSDPTDASDGGVANSRKKLRLTFGDNSGSESEKYVLELIQLAGEGNQSTRVINEDYGKMQTHDVFLQTDAVYKVTMKHISSNLEIPDRDYQLIINPPEGDNTILIVDDNGLEGIGEVGDGEPFPGEGKEIFIYCFDVKLIPDYNRDGNINATDEALGAQGTPLCMWVNDDLDYDVENGVNGGDEISVPKSNDYKRDGEDWTVNGKSDIEDFFPVKVSLGHALPFYLAKNKDKSLDFLDCDQLGILWCRKKDYDIERFYSLDNNATDACFGIDGDEQRWSATVSASSTSWFSDNWHECPSWLQSEIRSGECHEFMIFIEAEYASQNPLKLAIKSPDPFWYDSHVKDLATLPLQIAPVSEMYSVLNLRGTGNVYTAASMPPITSSDKLTAFIHGYSVSETEAEGWFNAVFKRLWQSGLNTHFCGITWHGDDEGSLPDYYKNVFNAFEAARRLDAAFSTVPLAEYTNKTILAHSLGNMVVSSAIQDYETPIDKYFMLNAAVPVEAYDSTDISYDFSSTTIPRGLIHDDWVDLPPQTWANFWHRHFIEHGDYTPTDVDEKRTTLTWHGRFKDVIDNRNVNVFNYYSAGTTENGNSLGDEVFELLNYTPSATEGFEWLKSKGRYSWQKQECYKGRKGTVALAWVASDVMGWGVEDDATLPTTDEGYRTAPYFPHNPDLILGNNASAITENRDTILAYGIPAMTEVVGKTLLANVVNLNCQEVYIDRRLSISWVRPRQDDELLTGRWLHSDIKDATYPFTRSLYQDIIQKGKLR